MSCYLASASTDVLASTHSVHRKASQAVMQDEAIQRFEDRCTEANAEIEQLQAAMQETSKRLDTADNRLASTMESRNKLRKQLEAKQAEMTSAQACLQADNEVLKVLSHLLRWHHLWMCRDAVVDRKL